MIADVAKLNGISVKDEKNMQATIQLKSAASVLTMEELMISYNTYLIQVRSLV